MHFSRFFGPVVSAILFAVLGTADYTSASCPPGPCPENCVVPDVIVGSTDGARIVNGFRATIKNSSNTPIANVQVIIDYTNTPIIPFDLQVFPTYNDCGSGYKRITQTTDSNGQVLMDPKTTGFTNSNSVVVYVKDTFGQLILIKSIKGRSVDCVTSASAGGTESTGLADYSYFSNNYSSNSSAQETDFDQNGVTGLSDYSIFSGQYGKSGTLCTP